MLSARFFPTSYGGKKPLNVCKPTVIKGERAREICALMQMSSGTPVSYHLGLDIYDHHKQAELNHIQIRAEDEELIARGEETNMDQEAASTSNKPSQCLLSQSRVRRGYVLHGTCFAPKKSHP